MIAIRRIDFICRVITHYQKNYLIEPWTIEDSFTVISENVDLADITQKEYDDLMADIKKNLNAYLECGP